MIRSLHSESADGETGRGHCRFGEEARRARPLMLPPAALLRSHQRPGARGLSSQAGTGASRVSAPALLPQRRCSSSCCAHSGQWPHLEHHWPFSDKSTDHDARSRAEYKPPTARGAKKSLPARALPVLVTATRCAACPRLGLAAQQLHLSLTPCASAACAGAARPRTAHACSSPCDVRASVRSSGLFGPTQQPTRSAQKQLSDLIPARLSCSGVPSEVSADTTPQQLNPSSPSCGSCAGLSA